MYGKHALIIGTHNKRFCDVLRITQFMVAKAYFGLSLVPGVTLFFIHFIVYLHILVPVNSVKANELLESESRIILATTSEEIWRFKTERGTHKDGG